MERLHVLECEDDIGEANSRDDDSNGPNRDRILGSVSLKANCYGAETTKPPHGSLETTKPPHGGLENNKATAWWPETTKPPYGGLAVKYLRVL